MEALKAIRSAVPTFESVTEDEAKSHLRIARSNEDHHDDLVRLIQQSRENFERDTDYVIATGTYVVKLSEWPIGDCIELPVRPVSSITSIAYLDTAGVSQTMSSGDYSLNTYGSRHKVQLGYGETWPTIRGWENDITITFVAGYASRSVVPANIKQACLLEIARLFENRGDSIKDEPTGKAYERIVSRYARSSYP